MSLTTVEYQDSICNAVNTIIEGRLSGIKYDFTDRCTIIDDSMANRGKYYVDNGKAKYYAYCENTDYKKGQNVYVLIPQNDYTKDKIITGKVISEDDSAIEVASPLDDIAIFKTLEFSKDDDFIYNNNTKSYNRSILANDPDIFSQEIISYTIEKEKLLGLTRMGLELDISAVFPYDFITSGTYGIQIDFYGQNQSVENNFLQGWEFLSTDFLGDPYNNSSVQQIILNGDLTFLRNYIDETLITIKVSLQQDQNFRYFDNIQQNFIPYSYFNEDTQQEKKLINNIVINSLKIHFGRLKTDFDEIETGSLIDIYPITAYIVGNNTDTIMDDTCTCTFGAKWFYKETNLNEDETINYIIYQMFDSIESINSFFSSNQEYDARILSWYTYNISKDDQGAGINWEDTNKSNFNSSIDFSVENKELRIKCQLNNIVEIEQMFNQVIYQSDILICRCETEEVESQIKFKRFSFEIEENPYKIQPVDSKENDIKVNGITVSYGDEAYSNFEENKYETRIISFGNAKMRFCKDGTIQIQKKINNDWVWKTISTE